MTAAKILAREEHGVAAMVRAYLECAAWSSSDWNHIGTRDNPEPLDAGDWTWTKAATATALADCKRFLAAVGRPDLGLASSDMGQLGHDLWLSRNGHGTGFWDREERYGVAMAARYHEAAKGMGEVNAYRTGRFLNLERAS